MRKYLTGAVLGLGVTLAVGVFAAPSEFLVDNQLTQTHHVMVMGAEKAMTDGSAVDFIRVAVAQSGHAHGTIWWSVWVAESGGGGDFQSMQGLATFAAVNKGGTVACDIQEGFGTDSYAESSGPSTLTIAFACTEDVADTIDISANVNTSFAATTTLNLEFHVRTAEDYTVTAL
jgi:hypothetical protein